LQWQYERSSSAVIRPVDSGQVWNLYKFDLKSGTSKKIHSGHTIVEYQKVVERLNRQGIGYSDIAFGGKLDGNALSRFTAYHNLHGTKEKGFSEESEILFRNLRFEQSYRINTCRYSLLHNGLSLQFNIESLKRNKADNAKLGLEIRDKSDRNTWSAVINMES